MFVKPFLSIIFVVLVLGAASCARRQITSPKESLRHSLQQVSDDDLGEVSLREALNVSLQRLEALPPDQVMTFGPHQIAIADYIQSLKHVLNHPLDTSSLTQVLNQEFMLMEVYGTDRWGQVFLTSYYEPEIQAASVPTGQLNQPLYRAPKDMILVDIREFSLQRPALFQNTVSEQRSRDRILRGRLVQTEPYPIIKPYFRRSEIDQGDILAGKNLEIAYVDPIDAFFLQIQGSGVLNFPDGRKLRVGYAAQNGWPYTPIGKYLFEVIPIEEMSLQRIESHLRTLSDEQMHTILDKNESYVFFQELGEKPAQTFFQTPVIAGRTIATDYSFFPKGALAFLQFKKPVFSSEESLQPEAWQPVSRVVVDHDTGGAIRGPGRVDLFWGRGPSAKQAAGVMRHDAKLYYLFPRSVLSRLSQLK